MPGHPTSDGSRGGAEHVELGQMRRRGGGEVRWCQERDRGGHIGRLIRPLWPPPNTGPSWCTASLWMIGIVTQDTALQVWGSHETGRAKYCDRLMSQSYPDTICHINQVQLSFQNFCKCLLASSNIDNSHSGLLQEYHYYHSCCRLKTIEV